MEALILAIVIAYAVKKAAEEAHLHWQGSKAANRKSTRGQPAGRRAGSAARHDAGYWAGQVRGAFPQARHGLYMGWHSGRIAQLQGREARANAKAEHAQARARVTEAVREQRRLQEQALQRIRAAARQPHPQEEDDGPPPDDSQRPLFGPGRHCAMCPRALPDGYEGAICPQCRKDQHERAQPNRPSGRENTGSTPPKEGNAMPTGQSSGDTTYTQQMHELEEIRRDAEAELNDVRRKRMQSRLDVLQNLSLDRDTLSEAADIDDALQELEKAAQKLLDAADAAINGLKQRHGGIQEAVSDSPVDKPAEPEFYQD